ncbi:MAG: hypothetical protein A3I61_06935 [Acidobacteria bacterium RIFCSPLOWO2_02_FULL_68_18]|nr:MAG: hypothetical protein A3I61_06935 [Acidobacteria bacterium RIFCSPLOWO2_02_FULL_68_18]OFW48327.1 MAG: hypothetical protein A3G77_03525 [Acidobacteria bacterium RIFCSPLOWO2_12_FULL_68_19]
MVTISLSEREASVLREWLEPKVVDLRKEESHTDSPRFRETLYEVEGALKRLVDQLPRAVPAK